MKNREITNQADQLLVKMKVTAAPVPVLEMAGALGIKVRTGPLPDELSGFLVREEEAVVIGVNSLHPKPRQAFTLAHELGHYFLHPSGNFVDRTLIYFRDTRSAEAVDAKEIQANRFAADLLMPERFLHSALKGKTVDLEDERRLGDLAKSFGVSVQALMFRIINLNLARQG
ncbi:MAG: ImmA/IrrE family metallo-endopeptidase [Acidiferrobacteraceae bacterium]